MKKLLAALLLLVLAVPAEAQPPTTCQGNTVNDLRASDAEDYLTGSEGSDVIALGTGADQYFAYLEADIVCGNEGADVLAGENGADALWGGEDDDIVAGHGGADVVGGGPGSDVVKGNSGADVVRAGADQVRDDLYDGIGSDTIIGTAEDVWHRCGDDVADDHSGFSGIIVPDVDCG